MLMINSICSPAIHLGHQMQKIIMFGIGSRQMQGVYLRGQYRHNFGMHLGELILDRKQIDMVDDNVQRDVILRKKKIN